MSLDYTTVWSWRCAFQLGKHLQLCASSSVMTCRLHFTHDLYSADTAHVTQVRLKAAYCSSTLCVRCAAANGGMACGIVQIQGGPRSHACHASGQQLSHWQGFPVQHSIQKGREGCTSPRAAVHHWSSSHLTWLTSGNIGTDRIWQRRNAKPWSLVFGDAA